MPQLLAELLKQLRSSISCERHPLSVDLGFKLNFIYILNVQNKFYNQVFPSSKLDLGVALHASVID